MFFVPQILVYQRLTCHVGLGLSSVQICFGWTWHRRPPGVDSVPMTTSVCKKNKWKSLQKTREWQYLLAKYRRNQRLKIHFTPLINGESLLFVPSLLPNTPPNRSHVWWVVLFIFVSVSGKKTHTHTPTAFRKPVAGKDPRNLGRKVERYWSKGHHLWGQTSGRASMGGAGWGRHLGGAAKFNLPS